MSTSNSQPAPLSKQQQLLDPKASVPTSPYSNTPTTKLSSLWPFKFPYPPWKSNTQPNNSHSTFPIAVNRYRVIGSCVCLLAFYVSRKNPSNRTSLQAAGDTIANKVRQFFIFLYLKMGLWNWRKQNLRRF